jgi:2-iminobutanoate/2-iminopropanoate deaminase
VARSSGSRGKQPSPIWTESRSRTISRLRACFTLIDRTLNRVGGKLADLVTMTVSINDPRYGDRFIKIRHEMFPNAKFPCSALITVSNFAHPGILIEIQGVAVV